MNKKMICRSLLGVFFVFGAHVAHADLAFAPTEVTVRGSEATKIAEMMIVGNDEKGTHAKGRAQISCLQKPKEKHFTCVIKKLSEAK